MGTACKNSQTACRTQDQKLLILHPVGYELPVPADAEQIVPRGFFQNGGGYPAEHINIRKNFFLFRRKGKPSGYPAVSSFFPPGYADTACRAAVLFQAPFILQRLFTQEYRAVRRGREFRKASRMIIVAVAENDPVKAFLLNSSTIPLLFMVLGREPNQLSHTRTSQNCQI